MRRLGALAMAMALGGCAGLPLACPAGQAGAREVRLVFGRNIAGQPGVSEADFRAFVDAELTPRFPDGLTVIDAQGQWRGAAATPEREASKLVLLVLAAKAAGADAKLEAVRAAYKARFRQESVMILSQPVCAGF